MAALAELDASLQALLTLKPPGVTKGRISTITQLCVENIKSESIIIQKVFTHFKRTPATHKLGVLYAVDSVARQWIDKAGANGQDIRSSSAQDGTFAAGVNHVTELIPTLMTDLIAQAPDDQLEKVNKLIDIWERGNTFPSSMISDFKSKVATRPVRQPSPELEKPAEDAPAPIPDTPAPATQVPQVPQAAQTTQAMPTTQPPAPIPVPHANGQPTQQPAPQAAQPTPNGQPQNPMANTDGFAALAKVVPPSALSDPQKLTHYMQVMNQLVQLGVPVEQWGDVFKALNEQQNSAQQPSGAPQTQVAVPGPQQVATVQGFGVQERRQSPPRGRSRSPARRASPGYGAYGQNSYRQRSPRRSFSPVNGSKPPPPPNGPKWVQYDPTLPANHIKVLSRTLFVGGTTCHERELREVFSRFGNVQSVICNPQKRHAFVKMYTREESLRAKTEMDRTEDSSILSRARSTKWGVGFGPRECCDYTEGVSVIPVDRLTDADRRWILSAEYGGNGGQDITHGQVMEEPDIEIGAGVSSKAISLRVGAGGNQQQPRKQQHHRGGGGRNRDRDRDHHGNPNRIPPGYNPNNPFPPGAPSFGPPPQEPMPMGMPPPMQNFGFAPPQQGGFNMFPPGMPPFPMNQ